MGWSLAEGHASTLILPTLPDELHLLAVGLADGEVHVEVGKI